MNACDADIVNRVHFIAHHFRRHLRFLRYRQIARACAYHRNFSLATKRPVAPDPHRAGVGKILGVFMLLPQARSDLAIRPRNQHVWRFRQKCRDDRRHLDGSLALSENHFRHAVAQRAMMIDLGKPKILERKMPQPLNGLALTIFLSTDRTFYPVLADQVPEAVQEAPNPF